MFEYRCIYKVKWRLFDYVKENQIDYVCICLKLRQFLQDVRVKRRVDVVLDYDIVLVKFKFYLKGCKLFINVIRIRYNVDLLSDKEIVDKFKINFVNRYQVLQQCYDDEDIWFEVKWSQIKRNFFGYDE